MREIRGGFSGFNGLIGGGAGGNLNGERSNSYTAFVDIGGQAISIPPGGDIMSLMFPTIPITTPGTLAAGLEIFNSADAVTDSGFANMTLTSLAVDILVEVYNPVSGTIYNTTIGKYLEQRFMHDLQLTVSQDETVGISALRPLYLFNDGARVENLNLNQLTSADARIRIGRRTPDTSAPNYPFDLSTFFSLRLYLELQQDLAVPS